MSAQDLLEDIKTVAPGTALREAIDNIIRARTGALIVLGDGPQVMDLVDGGVRLDAEFSPSLLYEVAKMDGAIILNKDLTRITCVNAQLWPKKDIPSQERGIRHKTAERTAVQTGEMVVAISERRNVVTLFRGHSKYVLRDISFILSKANQALQTLSNYRARLDDVIRTLDRLELEGESCLGDVVLAVRRIEMIWKMVATIDRYVMELGIEGRLVKMQRDEIVGDTHRQHTLIIRDYVQGEGDPEDIIRAYRSDAQDIPPAHAIAEALGYDATPDYLSLPLRARGYRLLKRIPRLPIYAAGNLVKEFGDVTRIMRATVRELDEVDGIGEIRAKAIQEGLARLGREARFQCP